MELSKAVQGMKIMENNYNSKTCEIYIATKMEKKPFKNSERKVSKSLELIHIDIVVPWKRVEFKVERLKTIESIIRDE
jgi:hypothetical protein